MKLLFSLTALLILTASNGWARDGDEGRVNTISVIPPAAAEAQFADEWVKGFAQLDARKSITLVLIRGDQRWEVGPVIELAANGPLLRATEGLSREGRRIVFLRAADVVAIEERP